MRLLSRGREPGMKEDLEAIIEELDRRLEQACLDFDPCFGAFCWQFAAGYLCPEACGMECQPFHGCHPYCYE
jgi:hypothetical protein